MTVLLAVRSKRAGRFCTRGPPGNRHGQPPTSAADVLFDECGSEPGKPGPDVRGLLGPADQIGPYDRLPVLVEVEELNPDLALQEAGSPPAVVEERGEIRQAHMPAGEPLCEIDEWFIEVER